MNKKEFEEYLKSIGGLKNGYFTDRGPIISGNFVGEGWFDLLKDLIEELIKDGWDKEICQIKEKFGTLRFYTNGGGNNHHKIISKYEKLSSKICEECGKKGEERNTGWIKTLCSEHYIEPILKDFKTKDNRGFTKSELKKLLKSFKKINMDKFNDAMFGNTCMKIDDEIIYYFHDVRSAIYCGVENRNQRIDEWD